MHETSKFDSAHVDVSVDRAALRTLEGRPKHGGHLDRLVHKLREKRVQRVIEPMLSGVPHRSYSTRDLEYVRDLASVARDTPPRLANPIYSE